jgi:chromosome segregation ATPase
MDSRAADEANNATARSSEAMRIKDEQLRMLQEQNSRLLTSLDTFEAEISALSGAKSKLEDENRRLKDNVFELSTKMGATEASRARMSVEVTDKDKQLKTIAAQNSELLRLLEAQEDRGQNLEAEVKKLEKETSELQMHLASHGANSRYTEERNQGLQQELALRTEEVRISRLESDQLRSALADAQRAAAVEIDSLQEALRVRKEKQYSLLEKTAAAEEIARKSADEIAQLKEALRGAHARVTELETRLAMEERVRRGQADTTKSLSEESAAARATMVELQARLEKSDSERIRLESELRTSGEQLKDMADKVFALLERLKLAELGKTKAVEAMKTKDNEIATLKKRAEKAAKEAVKEAKARSAVEIAVKQLGEEIEVRTADIAIATSSAVVTVLMFAHQRLPSPSSSFADLTRTQFDIVVKAQRRE